MAKPYVLQSADLANTLNTEIGNFNTLSTEDNSSIINGLNEVAIAGYETPVTTSADINNITTDRNKLIKITDIQGKTIINLLGNDGDCEDTTRWTNNNGCTLSLDSTNKVFNNNALKITIAVGTWASILKDLTNVLDKTKYYCISAYVKNGNYTNGILMTLNNGTSTFSTSVITDTTKFNRIFIKLQPSNIGTSTNALNVGNMLPGSIGQYGYVDGIMLEEITATQYNDSNFVPSPYVNGDYSVGDSITRLKTRGKNLINLVQGGIYWQNGTLNTSIALRLTHKDARIPVKPGTTYTISLSSPLSYCLGEYDCNYNCLTPSAVTNYSSGTITSYTFTTSSNTKYIAVGFRIDDSTVIYAENYQIQIEEGSTATVYEPYKESYLNIQYPLRSLPNGVIDEVVNINGTPKLIQRTAKYNLDGTLPWTYDSSGTGYKTVKLINVIPNFVDMSCNILKPNGKWLIKNTGTLTAADNCSIWNPSNCMWISISSADSGWGDSYTPSQAEIQAYFNGWKMYDCAGHPDGTGVYNGTGTKAWCYPYLNGSGYVGGTQVLPSNTSVTPYFFAYRLFLQQQTPVLVSIDQPELIAFYNNGNASSLIMESDGTFIRPAITYQIADNIKANIDDLMKNVNDTKRLTTMTNGQVNSTFPFGLAIQAGLYRVADGSGIGDGPYTSGGIWGLLQVFVSSDSVIWNKTNNWIWQYFYCTNGVTYFRNAQNSGNWSAWRQTPLIDTTGALLTKGFRNAYSGILTSAVNLDTGAFGGFFEISGNSTYTTTMPSPGAVPGATITFWNNSATTQTIATAANAIYGSGASGTSITMPTDASIVFMSDGYNWIVTGGTYLATGRVMKSPNSNSFKVQSGSVSVASQAFAVGSLYSFNVTFPTAFAGSVTSVVATCTYGNNSYGPIISCETIGLTGFVIKVAYTSAITTAPTFNYMAIGN